MERGGEVLLQTKNLNKVFTLKNTKGLSIIQKDLKAVNDVSLSIQRGEICGLVGESGCGKSTFGRCVLQLIKPTSGLVTFLGRDVVNPSRSELKELRKEMQIIFQDPYSSLNPRIKIGKNLEEVLKVNALYRGRERERVEEMLNLVGLDSAAIQKYPHQFSGGQLQRIAIARALLVEPKFIVADECVSALDVSVQAQVINLLLELKEKMDLTILFISHDLSVVEHISDKIGVMYLGKIVEYASTEEIFQNTRHPYTKALLSAIPVPDPDAPVREGILEGDRPSPLDLPPGCPLVDRCPDADPICSQLEPILKPVAPDHDCACLMQRRM